MFVLFMLSIAAVANIWKGFVLSVIWGWFIVPLFHLPALSIPAAIAVATVVSLLTYQNNAKDSESNAFEMIFSAFVGPLVALFTGWVLTFFL